MNKEDLIRNLKYTREKHKNDFVPTFGTNISLMCEDILNYLEQEQRWIPVSERLPKVFEFVNVTCHSLIDDRDDWVAETVYIPQPSDSPYSDWGNIPMLNWGECEVVAWMHREIPEPYEADRKESEE